MGSLKKTLFETSWNNLDMMQVSDALKHLMSTETHLEAFLLEKTASIKSKQASSKYQQAPFQTMWTSFCKQQYWAMIFHQFVEPLIKTWFERDDYDYNHDNDY